METIKRIVTRKMVDNMDDSELEKWVNRELENYDEDSLVRKMVYPRYIQQDILKASKGKRHRDYVVRVIGNNPHEDFTKNPNGKLMKTIRYTQLVILTNSFYPRKHAPLIVKDKCSNKEREIIKPDFGEEQILHHALIRVLQPYLYRGMYRYSCASIPGRGIHYARNYIEKILANDIKNTKYVLKMDIRKFFNSISHRRLKKKLKGIIKEPTVRKLLWQTIDSADTGLPLGYYTSQWLANFYLQSLDHYIKERILEDCKYNAKRHNRFGAKYYIRYMDDMVIFGPNKKELRKIKEQLDKVLFDEYGLELKDDWQIFRFDYEDKSGKRKGRPLDFVGFQFYRDKITIRKRIYKKMRKLIKKMKKKGKKKISFHDASAMMSYFGFIYWSDSKSLYNKLLKPKIKLKDLKKVIREEMKMREKELENK